MPQLKGGSPSEPKGKDSWATLSRWCTTLSQEAFGLHSESSGDLSDHQTEVSVNFLFAFIFMFIFSGNSNQFRGLIKRNDNFFIDSKYLQVFIQIGSYDPSKL
jgi:hypothetical protein